MSDNYMISLTSPTLVNGNFPSLPISNNHQQNGPIPNAIPNAMPNSGNSSHLTSHTSTPQPLTINANLHSNSTSGPSSSSYEDQQTILSSSIPNSHVTNNNIHHHNNSNNNNSNNNHNNHNSATSNNPASHPSGNSTSNANHQHSINGPPGNNQFILKITNIPKDVTVRESRLIFSLVIDDIVKIELNQENEQPRILAVFKNFNTCVTTYKLLNNKYLFNESPIIVEIDDMFLQTNQNNQNNNTTGTTNNNNNNEEYLSAPKSSIPSISSASASASAPNSSNSNRSRFIFNDPFNNDLDLNLNNLNLNGGNANNANLMNWQDSHSQPPTPLNNLGFDWNAKQNSNNQANNQPKNQPTNANNNGSSNGNNSYDNANSKNNRRTSSAFFQSNFSNNLLNNSFMNSNYQPLNLVQSNQPSQPLPNSQSNSISGPVPSQVGQVSGQGKGQVSQQVPTQQVPTQQVQNQQVPTQQVQNQQVPSQVQNQGQVGQIPSNGTTNQPSQTVQGSSNNGSTVTSPNQQVSSSSSTLLRKDIPDLSLLARVPPPANPADQNPPCNTLYVGNLPPDATEQELRNLFSPQKGFRRLSFRTKTTNSTNSTHGPMCFVEFEDVAHATKALADLYGRILPRSSSSNGKGGIRLSFSKNPLGVRGPQRRSSSNQVNGGFGYNNYHVKP